jgi:RNA polymerase sigma-70 factor (ECF subfamily)
VALLRLGDNAAFETLVRTYGPRMLALARHYVKSEADAEDVLQSAYLLVFRFIPRFAGASKLSTWLHRIVVNSALMLLRYRRRHPEVSLDRPSLENERSACTGAGWATLEAASDPEAIERTESHRSLLAALERLPDTDRAAVRLCDVSGLTIMEAAQLVGRCSTTVKRDLRRGREALGAILTRASRRSRVRGSRVRSSRGLPGAPLGSYAVARS